MLLLLVQGNYSSSMKVNARVFSFDLELFSAVSKVELRSFEVSSSIFDKNITRKWNCQVSNLDKTTCIPDAFNH